MNTRLLLTIVVLLLQAGSSFAQAPASQDLSSPDTPYPKVTLDGTQVRELRSRFNTVPFSAPGSRKA